MIVHRLLSRLTPAVDALGISFWSDNAIGAGSHWDAEIEKQIGQTDIFLACMSAAYLGSRYLYYTEFPALMERGNSKDVLVIPVILTDCPWWGFVGDYQATPTRQGRVVPIANWRPREAGINAAALQIINAIRAYLGLDVVSDERLVRPIKHKASQSHPIMPSGPHRLSPDDIDRAVKAIISRRATSSEA